MRAFFRRHHHRISPRQRYEARGHTQWLLRRCLLFAGPVIPARALFVFWSVTPRLLFARAFAEKEEGEERGALFADLLASSSAALLRDARAQDITPRLIAA
jgi:hypothetical protein